MCFLQYDGRHFTLHEGHAEENGQVHSGCHYWKAKQPLVLREAPTGVFQQGTGRLPATQETEAPIQTEETTTLLLQQVLCS